MKELVLQIWKHPDYYGGFSPDGDYLVYSRHRDSSILTNSNFECIQDYLETKVAEWKLHKPKKRSLLFGEQIPNAWVYTFSANCFAYGWREYLLVQQDAPIQLVEEANRVMEELVFNYPIYNEDDYSRRQDEAITEYWEHISLRERMEYCKDVAISIFSARTDSIPREVYDHLYDNSAFA